MSGVRARAVLAVIGAAVAAASPAADPPGKDAFGDPLPPGVKLRLGTSRFMTDGVNEHPSRMTFSPDCRSFLVTKSGPWEPADSVIAYSTDTGLRIWATPIDPDSTGNSVGYTPDGKSVVTSGRKGLAVWDAATG